MQEYFSIFSVGIGDTQGRWLNEVLYCRIVISASSFGWRGFAPLTLTWPTCKAKDASLLLVAGQSVRGSPNYEVLTPTISRGQDNQK